MRFMMLMIPAGYETAAPDALPPVEAVAAMMKYNEALKEAGVLITLDGLHPPSSGARVSFAGGKPVVTDGPFTESKELISYALYEVRSKEEAVEWASRFIKVHRDHWAGWTGSTDVLQVMGPVDPAGP